MKAGGMINSVKDMEVKRPIEEEEEDVRSVGMLRVEEEDSEVRSLKVAGVRVEESKEADMEGREDGFEGVEREVVCVEVVEVVVGE